MAASETDTLYRYRVRCVTEGAYVFVWGKEAPTACPNDSAHTIDQGMLTVVDSVSNTTQVVANLPNTVHDSLRTTGRVQTMALRSCYGINPKQDYVTTSGSGFVTNTFPGDGAYTLRIASSNSSNSSNSSATLRSVGRFHAVSAFQAEAAVSCAVPQISSQDASILKVGAYDDTDGMYFKFTSTGPHVGFLRNGEETLVAQLEWNNDIMDGTGISGITLDPSAGVTWKILYTCHGFGPIRYAVCTVNPETRVEHTWTVHVHMPDAASALRTPNLPLVAGLERDSQAVSQTEMVVTVRDRFFCLHGSAYPEFRRHVVWGESMRNINSSSTFRHLFSIRHRDGYHSVPVKVVEVAFASNQFLVLQLRIGATLDENDDRDWEVDSNTDTAVETNTEAENMSGGVVVWSGAVHDDSQLFDRVSIDFDLPDKYAVSLCGIGMRSNSPRPTGFMAWKEFW